jgi:hypothetical protein
MIVLAIDPGNEYSAWVLIDTETYRPLKFDKANNLIVLHDIAYELEFDKVVIEKIASYGMPVGESVFDTCMWIGRFQQAIEDYKRKPSQTVRRYEVKMNICHDARARDSNIIQALVDRFAPGQMNRGKGTKKEPGWFYGFRADVWQAYALGVTYIDRYIKMLRSKEHITT